MNDEAPDPKMIGCTIENEPVEVFRNGQEFREFKQGPIFKYQFRFSDGHEFEYKIDESEKPTMLSHVVKCFFHSYYRYGIRFSMTGFLRMVDVAREVSQ